MKTDNLIINTELKKQKKTHFTNTIPTPMTHSGSYLNTMKELLLGKNKRIPSKQIPVLQLKKTDFKINSNTDLRFVRLGHSTVYIEIEGIRLLTDPIFSHRASPVKFLGPRRFHAVPVHIDDLPEIDAVLISHNHYDHLDIRSINLLKDKVKKFMVPLGVSKMLKQRGIAHNKIVELNWWESTYLNEELSICATPARHFSGRRIIDNGKTNWNSWSIIGKEHKLFFSGDTGFFPGLSEIGEKYGIFNITLLECGAYNESWSNVHMFPEETLQAHDLLRGDILCPIHWATFDLSLHSWTEPVERLLKAAEGKETRLAVPQIGEFVDYKNPKPVQHWWKNI